MSKTLFRALCIPGLQFASLDYNCLHFHFQSNLSDAIATSKRLDDVFSFASRDDGRVSDIEFYKGYGYDETVPYFIEGCCGALQTKNIVPNLNDANSLPKDATFRTLLFDLICPLWVDILVC